MDSKTKVQVLLVTSFVILIAGVFYFCYPKYEIYQSARDGTITYRFNKITGSFQSPKYNGTGGEWEGTVPISFIKRP